MRSFLPLLKLKGTLGYSKTFRTFKPLTNCINCKTKEVRFVHLCSSHSTLFPHNQTEDKNMSDDNFDPKKTVWRIINEEYIKQLNPNLKPIITCQQVKDEITKNLTWHVTIEMTWPCKFQVESISNKKSEAEKKSYISVCQKLKELGVLTENCSINTNTDNMLNSKAVLCNIYELIWTRFGKKEYIPLFKSTPVPSLMGDDKFWRTELKLIYPEEKTFEGLAVRMRDAERIVSSKALQWLKTLGIINSRKKLIHYTKDEDRKLFEQHSTPYSLCLPKELQSEMKTILENLNDESIISFENLKAKPPDELKETEFKIYDIITEQPYREKSEDEIANRSQEMLEKSKLDVQCSPEIQEIRFSQLQLPIYQKREDILNLIEKNQVLVISGETGCGKTTQVPQFILDHYIKNSKGALCNIVVTQPRRISAISIAERVAFERDEKIGETVGYQIRLNKKLPAQNGAILFCSTGMLLRKLSSNPTLEGVSHVIVDEVHERNIQIDFLLILLKKLIETNKKIKILIMSASFNTIIFSNYFNNCPVIHTPGRNYPVQDYYLDEILTMEGVKHSTRTDPVLDCTLMAQVINQIDKTQKPGAILCFLPGWNEILSVNNKLLDIHSNPSNLRICCAHSRLPQDELRKLFIVPPSHIRKVILATNIAETSITINDVIYVINSGLHKETSFDSEQAVSSLSTRWITKANVRQRSGRAGRLQPGVCYNLFTRKVLMQMEDYPLPELLKMPLETVILDCKRYCPNSSAEDFLSIALQAPNKSSLQAGIEELRTIGILDENECLTDLGEIVVNFGTHPRLSVLLVCASFFRCLDPVLTICALLTIGKEPFLNTLEDKSLIKNIKKAYDNCHISDHLSSVKIFEEWKNKTVDTDASQFVEGNKLDEQSLTLISDLKQLFAESLAMSGIIYHKSAYLDPQSKCNENSQHILSILACLSIAFYPNIIKVLQGEISQNRLNKDTLVYSLIKGQRGYIQKESVASNEFELPTPWLVYFSALQSKARRLMMTSAVSSIPGICIPLLMGKELSLEEKPNGKNNDLVTIILDNHKKLNFSCSREEYELLLQFRNKFKDFFHIYLTSIKSKEEDHLQAMLLFYNQFLPAMKNILATPQVPFTKGQTYKFVDNCLVAEDL